MSNVTSPKRMKPCKICGKMFLPATPSSRFCSDDHYAVCPICGKQIIWNSTQQVTPCSKECRKEATRRKNQAKYGCDHPMQNKTVQENHKKAMLEKYGVEYALQSDEIKQKAVETNREKFGTDWALSNDDIRTQRNQTMIDRYGAATTLQSEQLSEKVHQTNLERYGHENAMQSEEIQSKAKATNLERYGVENPMQNTDIAQKSATTRAPMRSEITEKIRKTCIERYGVSNPAQSEESRKKISEALSKGYVNFKDKMIATNMKRYGVPYYCMTDECKQAQGDIVSAINRKFGKLLEANNIPYKFEFRLENYSYDIQILNTNILIEIDPTYTHNLIGNHWGDGLDKYYHRDKSQVARDHGYRCIHVFDWDDWNKIVDIIKPKERLYARECDIWVLKKDFADHFLNQYHIQGTCRGQLLSLGLIKDGECYQIMTFGKSRYDKSHKIELLRLCTRAGYQVIGGASKLFKYAVDVYDLYDIISYCDLSKFNGDVYEKLGMQFLRKTPPQEIWSDGYKKITANLLRQRGYDQLFHTSYGKGSSNEELMLQNGWLPICDCGQAVYLFS